MKVNRKRGSMETLEKGKQKLNEICEILRKETLEPAGKEAESILDKAKKQALKIVEDARGEASALLKKAEETIEKEKSIFQTSLDLAAKKSFEKLRGEIETQLFREGLEPLTDRAASDAHVMADVINALIDVLKKEGLRGNLALSLGERVNPKEMAERLTKDVLDLIKDQPFEVASFKGGAVLNLKDKKLSIDISDVALKELFGSYLREDFRKILFKHFE